MMMTFIQKGKKKIKREEEEEEGNRKFIAKATTRVSLKKSEIISVQSVLNDRVP